MKQGIIFDMDGTLWDSSEQVAESWNLAIREFGFKREALAARDIQNVMGRTMDVIAEILFAELPGEERMRLMDFCCRRENDYLREHGGRLYDGVEETFRRLLARGYLLYIVSNCQKGYIEAFLDYYGFRGYIGAFACYGDNLLPKDGNIRRVVEENGLGRAVYVGDIQGDYDASVKAGVGFIHAAYGFGTVEADVREIHAFAELAALQEGELFMRKGA